MKKFWNWYARLKEPWRFLVAMSLLIPGCFAVNNNDFWIRYFGCLYFLLLILTCLYYTR